MDALNPSRVSPPAQLFIDRAVWEQMLVDVRQRSPQEACGLLGGKMVGDVYRARRVFPTTNTLHSPTRYRIEPSEQLAAFEQMEAEGLELVGIYHSHPHGPPLPSATDLAEAYYPETVYVIWCGENDTWECNGFALRQQSQIDPVVVTVE